VPFEDSLTRVSLIMVEIAGAGQKDEQEIEELKRQALAFGRSASKRATIAKRSASI
jgi:hypothetical protein